MALYLIRCAKAVRTAQWDGPNTSRPLTAAGRLQANDIADWLTEIPVSHVLSSPYTRCVETVTPLAERHSLDVEQVHALAPSKNFEAAMTLIHALPDHAVLCSHGALIARVMEILTRQGAELEGPSEWRRGSTWVLERDNRKVVRACTVPPGHLQFVNT